MFSFLPRGKDFSRKELWAAQTFSRLNIHWPEVVEAALVHGCLAQLESKHQGLVQTTYLTIKLLHLLNIGEILFIKQNVIENWEELLANAI